MLMRGPIAPRSRTLLESCMHRAAEESAKRTMYSPALRVNKKGCYRESTIARATAPRQGHAAHAKPACRARRDRASRQTVSRCVPLSGKKIRRLLLCAWKTLHAESFARRAPFIDRSTPGQPERAAPSAAGVS